MKTEKKQKIKAGVVQLGVRLSDIETNLSIAVEQLRILGNKGVDLVVLPELWSCGFDHDRLVSHSRKTPEIIAALSTEAARLNMIIAGSLPELFENNLFNTLYVIDTDGSIAGEYRKIHLFSLNNEDRYFCAGNRAVVCQTSAGLLGLMICYDLRFPELCRTLALKKAQVVIVSAQWPKVRIEHWNVLLRARAIENQLYMVAANICGSDGNQEYGGCSQIVSPQGDLLFKAKDAACAMSAILDFNEVEKFRKQIPCLHERSPNAYVS